MSECKILNALVSTCQECVEDCEDAKYEILKLLAEAKEVGGMDCDNPPGSPSTWEQVSFWIRR
jgi:hypothetical protein